MRYCMYLVRLGYEERALRDNNSVERDAASNEEFSLNKSVINVDIPALQTGEMFKSLGRDEVAYFFMYLADNTLEVRLAPFAMTTKKGDLAGMHNAGDIVALLKQEPAVSVNDNRTGDLAIMRFCHYYFRWHCLVRDTPRTINS